MFSNIACERAKFQFDKPASGHSSFNLRLLAPWARRTSHVPRGSRFHRFAAQFSLFDQSSFEDKCQLRSLFCQTSRDDCVFHLLTIPPCFGVFAMCHSICRVGEYCGQLCPRDVSPISRAPLRRVPSKLIFVIFNSFVELKQSTSHSPESEMSCDPRWWWRCSRPGRRCQSRRPLASHSPFWRPSSFSRVTKRNKKFAKGEIEKLRKLSWAMKWKCWASGGRERATCQSTQNNLPQSLPESRRKLFQSISLSLEQQIGQSIRLYSERPEIKPNRLWFRARFVKSWVNYLLWLLTHELNPRQAMRS